MMMVVPPSLRGQVFLIHDNVRYARCVNFPPIPRVQRNVRNVFLLKEKAAAIFFFSADYTEHPPAAAAQCCHFQISNKTYIHQRSCLLCHPCPSDDSSGNQTYRIWGQPLCCFQAYAFCEAQARGKGQARIGKGWQSRRQASKPKPLPRAYRVSHGIGPTLFFAILSVSTLPKYKNLVSVKKFRKFAIRQAPEF